MNDPEVVEEINSAARLHAECMVKAVMFRVTQRTDIGLSKNTVLLSKLKQLWEDNLQTNTETTPTIEQDVTSYVGIANANKHRRLNFSVGSTIPSIYGRPAMFMDRPLYACDVLSQKTKPDGTESKRKTVKDRKKKTEPAVLESPPPIDLVENEEYDVIIGTLIQVKLGALLDKAAGRSGTEALLVNQDKWVEGRVASIVTADSSSRIRNRAGASHNPLTQVKSQLLTLKIRFRNGAELDVKWPDSAHLRTPTLTDAVTGARSAYINDSTNLSQTAPFRHAGGGDSSRSTANDNDEASNILNQVFGSLIDSDSEDEEWIGTSGLGGANASLHKGGDQALRILLGDFEFDDIAKAGGTSVDISGAGRDRGAPASVGASGCLPVRSESTSAGHGSGSSSTIGIGGGSGRRQQTVAAAVAQLATGERVSQAQLQYIEDTFIEGYRPRFRIMPAQRDCAGKNDSMDTLHVSINIQCIYLFIYCCVTFIVFAVLCVSVLR